MNPSPEDELAIKKKEICLVSKEKFVEGSEETSVCDHDHLSNPILSEGSIFCALVNKSCNLKFKQQHFLPVSMHNSFYHLKFILPALER